MLQNSPWPQLKLCIRRHCFKLEGEKKINEKYIRYWLTHSSHCTVEKPLQWVWNRPNNSLKWLRPQSLSYMDRDREKPFWDQLNHLRPFNTKVIILIDTQNLLRGLFDRCEMGPVLTWSGWGLNPIPIWTVSLGWVCDILVEPKSLDSEPNWNSPWMTFLFSEQHLSFDWSITSFRTVPVEQNKLDKEELSD